MIIVRKLLSKYHMWIPTATCTTATELSAWSAMWGTITTRNWTNVWKLIRTVRILMKFRVFATRASKDSPQLSTKWTVKSRNPKILFVNFLFKIRPHASNATRAISFLKILAYALSIPETARKQTAETNFVNHAGQGMSSRGAAASSKIYKILCRPLQ